MEPQFDKPELKCRGGCGFYGNPNWEGYCSLCKKKYLSPSTQGDEFNLSGDRLRTPSFSVKAASTPPSSPSLSRADTTRFSRETPVTSTLKKTVSHHGDTQTLAAPPISDRASPTSLKPKQGDRFTVMLRTLPRPVSVELENTVKHFLQKLHARTFASIDELSDFVQKFYQRLEEKLGKNNVYVALPSQVRDELWDEVEAHICLRLHRTVFAHMQDEEADLTLHNKLRSLIKEIKPVDLELPPAFADIDNEQSEDDDNMKHLLDDAFLAIIDMTTKTTPQEILGCLSACCSALFSALRAALPKPPSADDFLPALIYCVIRTNPPQIHSTIAYVERFALSRRILDGETAYYFTNLCCAVRYLDSTDAATIKTKKKPDPQEKADIDEAAELGCSVAAVKADHMIKKLDESQQEVAKRIEDFEDNVSKLSEKIQEDSRDLSEKITSACADADKAIETQLFIDFSDPPPSALSSAVDTTNQNGAETNKTGQMLKLYVLGTMDNEAVEQLKTSLVKPASDPTCENQQVASSPPLIDFDTELPPPQS